MIDFVDFNKFISFTNIISSLFPFSINIDWIKLEISKILVLLKQTYFLNLITLLIAYCHNNLK